MMAETKMMDLQEFIDKGYQQEIHRRFLHPLGLAMPMKPNPDGEGWILYGIKDHRNEPEGIVFTPKQIPLEVAMAKAELVAGEFEKRAFVRNKVFGFTIQPVGVEPIMDVVDTGSIGAIDIPNSFDEEVFSSSEDDR